MKRPSAIFSRIVLLVLLVGMLGAGAAFRVLPRGASPTAEVYAGPWDLAVLQQHPQIEWGTSTNYGTYTITELYYINEPYQGHPTRVFAYYAVPNGVSRPVPGMVLIHGGDGAAYADWAAQWARAGYAAIAMDLFGNGPGGTRLPDGGPILSHVPSALDTEFSSITPTTLKDIWSYHAVAATIRAVSVLTDQSDVDAQRIGMMGISWGGFTAAIVAGLDQRVKMGMIVYGAGFLDHDSYWKPILLSLSPEQRALWTRTFDPKMYLAQATIPLLWATGTNDYAYPLSSWQLSYRLPKGPRTLRLLPNWPHDYPTPWQTSDFGRYADEHLRAASGLLHITDQGRTGEQLWATYASSTPVRTAELHFTSDIGPYQTRTWHSRAATLDPLTSRVSAAIPVEATVYFLNLIDTNGYTVSSEHRSTSRIYVPVTTR